MDDCDRVAACASGDVSKGYKGTAVAWHRLRVCGSFRKDSMGGLGTYGPRIGSITRSATAQPEVLL